MASPNTSKAAKRASIASISTTSSVSSAASTSRPSAPQPQPQPPLPRRQSSVQLVPHSHTPTYFDSPLTPSEHSLITATENGFNDRDLSSQDFDFDDVFTFDRPYRKIPRVVEVSTPSRAPGTLQHHHHQQQQQHPQARDWSNFSFSHYGAVVQGNPRVRANHQQHGQQRMRPGMAGMQRELGLGIGAAYLRNQQVLMKGRR